MYVISTYEVLPKLLMSKLTSRSYILDREFWTIIGILPPSRFLFRVWGGAVPSCGGEKGYFAANF